MPPAPEMVTPAPRLIPTPAILPRQNIVTLSVTQSATPSPSIHSTPFPFAIAIPALVGGMALAIGISALIWWMHTRRKAKRRLEWEKMKQKRARKRANSPSTRRSSPSQSRKTSGSSGGGRSPTKEKDSVPAVPSLPKQSHQPSEKQSYSEKEPYSASLENPQSGHQVYPVQPSIDSTTSTSNQSSVSSKSSKSSKSSSKSSKSAARVAAAEIAAASAFGNPNTRYQPRKPSPLALARAAEREENNSRQWGEGPIRRSPTEVSPTSTLSQQSAQSSSRSGPFSDRHAPDNEMEHMVEEPRSPEFEYDYNDHDRATSGEWGVAMGSPNHDGSFEAQQGGSNSRYSNDPYLSVGNLLAQRNKSGQYTADPYASYHEDKMETLKERSASRSGWV